jgi:hypothetical protein
MGLDRDEYVFVMTAPCFLGEFGNVYTMGRDGMAEDDSVIRT